MTDKERLRRELQEATARFLDAGKTIKRPKQTSKQVPIAELRNIKNSRTSARKAMEKFAKDRVDNKIPLRDFLHHQAKFLRKIEPAGERWFYALFNKSKLKQYDDIQNHPFAGFIPDIINHRLRYVIEIQDRTHDQPARIARDKKKLEKLLHSGYRVFYVRAWNHSSYEQFLSFFSNYLKIKTPKTQTG